MNFILLCSLNLFFILQKNTDILMRIKLKLIIIIISKVIKHYLKAYLFMSDVN